jgi:hypothetical protein
LRLSLLPGFLSFSTSYDPLQLLNGLEIASYALLVSYDPLAILEAAKLECACSHQWNVTSKPLNFLLVRCYQILAPAHLEFLPVPPCVYHRLLRVRLLYQYIMSLRYDMREEDNGTWTVFDVFTGFPVIVNERMMISMEIQEADEMVELLNILDQKKRRATTQ